jgi:phage I-like protein
MVAHGLGLPIEFNSSGGAAEWIMLLPLGNAGVINTVDSRGPYRVSDAAKLAAESLQAAGGRLPIDENHATDLAAPNGGPSPARGWATALEVRPDGIYGKVEWSAPGAMLMSDKAYRFISPAFTADKAGNILGLLRASLTNTPNLRGMAALHAQETHMDLLAQLRKLLGLADDADAGAVVAKVKDACGTSTAMQSIAKAAGLAETAATETVLAAVTALKAAPTAVALASIAKAAGLKEDADVATVTAAVTKLAAGTDAGAVVSLQAELTDVTTKLNAVLATTAKDKAVAFVDGAIKEGRVGVRGLRDHYITQHAIDPARVEKEIGSFPKLGASGALETPPARNKDGGVSLNSEQSDVAKLLGLKPEDVAKTVASETAD